MQELMNIRKKKLLYIESMKYSSWHAKKERIKKRVNLSVYFVERES